MTAGEASLDLPPEILEKPSLRSVMRDPGVRALMISRFATMLGLATLSYGLMVYLATAPDGTPVAVGGPRVRSLLALLLLDAGRIVPAQTLVDGLYGRLVDPDFDAPAQVSTLRLILSRFVGAQAP